MMPDNSSSRKVGTRKARHKTFTGCWTCRARRVKCDDVHPHCLRCLRSGWQCQGYELRLGWSPALGSRSHRRQLWPYQPPVHVPAAAVTTLLSELDDCSADGSSQQRGPFSVFSASSSEPKDSEYNSSSTSTSVFSSGSHHKGEELDQASTGDSTADELSLALVSEVSYTTTPPWISEGNRRMSLESHESVFSAGDDSPVTTISFIVNQNTSKNLNSDIRNQHAPITHSPGKVLCPSPSTALNPLPLPKPETELVHHWVVFLSGHVVLIDTPDNPARTRFMPMALMGFDAPKSESSINLSIFHAICAASAFNLFYLRDDSWYHTLAVHHVQLALRHLRWNLQRPRRMNEPTLVAILCCVAAESMSGQGMWQTHVAGGLVLLENDIHSDWIRSPTAVHLLQSYLSLSSLCRLPMSTQLASLLTSSSEPSHYLERTHGITTPLIRFLAHITALIDSHTEIHVDMLDRLELQLFLNFPCVPTPNNPESIIIQHALNAFYYGTIVYFRRALRHVPLCDVQELVEKGVQELEALDALTNNKGNCAFSWTYFIVAAECERRDLQTRMLAYFGRKRRYGLQNYNFFCGVVQDLWHRRARAAPETDIQWQDILEEAHFNNMRV